MKPMVALLIAVFGASSFAFAGDEAGQAERPALRFGMSTCLTGPSADLGVRMREGVLAEFLRCNRNGGIRGRKLELVAYDDGYEPGRTAPNVRRLVSEDSVLAIIGDVGTPTAVAAVPIATETHTLFFAPYSGAGLLRSSPPNRYVINYRASYAQETAAMIDALIDDAGLRPDEIALFTQRDAYGDAGFSGAAAALKRRGHSDTSSIPHLRYERNTTLVERSVAEFLLLPTTPKAVVMVGTYAPCAKFIDLVTKAGAHPLFLDVSFVGSRSLAKALGKTEAAVIVTQVVPFHGDTAIPIVAEYLAAMKQQDSESVPGFISLEGFIAARILTTALEGMKGEPDREGIIDAIEGFGSFDVGTGGQLSLSPIDHQASDRVWPTILREGSFVPFDWKAIGSLIHGAANPAH